MRIRNVKNAEEILKTSPYLIQDPFSFRGLAKALFLKDQPIGLEIGTGKGNFLIGKAKENPHMNFIGVEKYSSVLVRAIQKLEEEELPNLKFLCIDAKDLVNVFDSEIEEIYLNFSDPWPKKRHARRRLTSADFLKIYDELFLNHATIIQKTDNLTLFESSLESLSQYGYILETVSLDLASSDIPNIMTEYEEKFTKQNQKIHYLKAVKK